MKETKITLLEDTVEDEDIHYNKASLDRPFRPNEIQIETPPFTIGYLMDRIEHGEINMNTDFQREGNLWRPQQQSRLIESILLGLPLPAFYFDTSPEAWDIIDGLQRCCSIQNFCVSKTLKLSGLEYLPMNGLGFDDLDRPTQRIIITRPIDVNLLKKSPANVRYILFKRLNTEGLTLKPPEIRNAIYRGVATKALAELATLPEFVTATCGKISTKRMEDKDFVCRFVAFYLTDYNNYTPSLDEFLNSSMELLSNADIKKLKQDFSKALSLATEIFGEDAFRKRTQADAQRHPINKAYFEVITVSFSKLSNKEQQSLRKHSELFKENLLELMNNKRFFSSLSATGTPDSVHIRFSWFQQVMQKSIAGKIIRIGDDNKIKAV